MQKCVQLREEIDATEKTLAQLNDTTKAPNINPETLQEEVNKLEAELQQLDQQLETDARNRMALLEPQISDIEESLDTQDELFKNLRDLIEQGENDPEQAGRGFEKWLNDNLKPDNDNQKNHRKHPE